MSLLFGFASASRPSVKPDSHPGYQVIADEGRVYWEMLGAEASAGNTPESSDQGLADKTSGGNTAKIGGSAVVAEVQVSEGELIKAISLGDGDYVYSDYDGQAWFGSSGEVWYQFQMSDGHPGVSAYIQGSIGNNGGGFAVFIPSNGGIDIRLPANVRWVSSSNTLSEGPTGLLTLRIRFEYGTALTVELNGVNVPGTFTQGSMATTNGSTFNPDVPYILGGRNFSGTIQTATGVDINVSRFAVTNLLSPSKSQDLFDLFNTFSTQPIPATPTVQASNLRATPYQEEMLLEWDLGDGDSSIVIMKKDTLVTAVPSNGTVYTANPEFGQGSELGSGNFVVYAGSGSSVLVTGLTRDDLWYADVYTFNANGYRYLGTIDTNTLTNGQRTDFVHDNTFANYESDYTENQVEGFSSDVINNKLVLSGSPLGYQDWVEHNDWTTMVEFQVRMVVEITDNPSTTGTPGIGLGIHNDYTTEPNRSVVMLLNTDTDSTAYGKAQIYYGNGGGGTSFIFVEESVDILPSPVLGSRYEIVFQRQQSGSNAAYTVTVTDLVNINPETQEPYQVVTFFTEAPDLSGSYLESTTRAYIYQNGGHHTIESFVIRRLSEVEPLPPDEEADWFVSLTGSDSNNGTSSSTPFRTLEKAASVVQQGDLVSIGPGTFVVNAYLTWPSASLKGAGIDQTILKIHPSKYRTIGDANNLFATISSNYALFNIKSGSMNTTPFEFSDFTVDGDKPTGSHSASTQCMAGVFNFENKSNWTLRNIKVYDVGHWTVWIKRGNDWRITGCDMRNASRGRVATGTQTWTFGTGMINWYQVEDCEIDNCYFQQEWGGCYGQSFHSNAWNITGYNNGSMNYVKRMKIHDCSGTSHQHASWEYAPGQFAASISFEFFKAHCEYMEIYNCELDANISIVEKVFDSGFETFPFKNAVSSWAAEGPNPTFWRWKIYNNRLLAGRRSSSLQYAIELDTHDAYIYDNWLEGNRSGAIVDFGSSVHFQNINIYRNVMTNIPADPSGQGYITEISGWRDVNILNNTIIFKDTVNSSSAAKSIMSVSGKSGYTSFTTTNVNIKNNIAVAPNNNSTFRIMSKGSPSVTGVVCDRNIFRNCNQFGPGVSGTNTNVLTSDPQFVGSGSIPDPYYRLSSGSPAINSGANVGLPYNGAAPDRGAYEF